MQASKRDKNPVVPTLIKWSQRRSFFGPNEVVPILSDVPRDVDGLVIYDLRWFTTAFVELIIKKVARRQKQRIRH
ncbi:unnamed protein product [Dovyalis caffra]|uniref:Uncharacterized protein n=1 Tax=Dovyalis caffra TaxID=77055 RepID=A0AAV1SW73_9ROSI|nr:unnamed protein product [Dovyalis caffra]